MKTIANSIRSLRLSSKMTQAQLAKKLGVQYQTVSKWENGITVPDTLMLPRLAEQFGITIDELFGIRQISCPGHIPEDTALFLLRTYSQMYGPEAGPWNLSVENKYLMYRISEFFESHFTVSDNTTICNIGIGAGEWDLYLSYQLKSGSLTSVDILDLCCKQLEQRLIYEQNPHDVRVICADVMSLTISEQFDIVTMVGSTLTESGKGMTILEKAMDLVKPGGALYYQSLDSQKDCNQILQCIYHHGMKLDAYVEDGAHGFCCHYYKIFKP